MAYDPLSAWQPHFAISVTGHRPDNPSFADNAPAVEAVLETIFERVAVRASALAGDSTPDVRMYTLCAQGVDLLAARLAFAKGWELLTPLPFGAGLNLAISTGAATRSYVVALREGGAASDPAVEQSAQAIRTLPDKAHLFEIADRDAEVRAALEAMLCDPHSADAKRQFDAHLSDNVALTGPLMIERSDLLIAVWDQRYANRAGDTGHTVMAALAKSTPVLLINPAHPEDWSFLTSAEELGHLPQAHGGSAVDAETGADTGRARLDGLVEAALGPAGPSMQAMRSEKWANKSTFGFGFYRRIEQFFGGRTTKSGTVQAVYEPPEAIAEGSAAPLLATAQSLLGKDDRVVLRLRERVLPAFAWSDGISSRLADAYRSGMSLNFLLSALAIIVGIAYLPLGLASQKWIFAGVELLLLAIIVTTWARSKRGWHRRWFETRRVAEYLRFGPVLAIMGVARPAARWPKGDEDEWPERFSRDALREVGLPEVRIDRAYLRCVL